MSKTRAAARLNVEIMRFLANTVPSLALKTCWANKSNKSNTTGYQVTGRFLIWNVLIYSCYGWRGFSKCTMETE